MIVRSTENSIAVEYNVRIFRAVVHGGTEAKLLSLKAPCSQSRRGGISLSILLSWDPGYSSRGIF
jgi:hypothetical protein